MSIDAERCVKLVERLAKLRSVGEGTRMWEIYENYQRYINGARNIVRDGELNEGICGADDAELSDRR